MVSSENEADRIVRYKTFASYMEHSLQVSVKMYQATDYAGTIEALKARKTEFTEQRIVALTCERQRGLSKANVLLGKDLAKCHKAFEGIITVSVTVGPFVITEDIDVRVLEGLE